MGSIYSRFTYLFLFILGKVSIGIGFKVNSHIERLQDIIGYFSLVILHRFSLFLLGGDAGSQDPCRR